MIVHTYTHSLLNTTYLCIMASVSTSTDAVASSKNMIEFLLSKALARHISCF